MLFQVSRSNFFFFFQWWTYQDKIKKAGTLRIWGVAAMQKGSVLKLTFHRHDLYIVRQVSKCKVVLLLDQWWTWHDKSKKAGMPGIWPPSSSSSFCAEMPVWTWPLHDGSVKAEMNALLYSLSCRHAGILLWTWPLHTAAALELSEEWCESRISCRCTCKECALLQVNSTFAFNSLCSGNPLLINTFHCI